MSSIFDGDEPIDLKELWASMIPHYDPKKGLEKQIELQKKKQMAERLKERRAKGENSEIKQNAAGSLLSSLHFFLQIPLPQHPH